LEKQILAVEKNPGDVDSPLTETMLIESLSNSADPIAKSNLEIMSTLDDLRREMGSLREMVAMMVRSSGIVSGSSPGNVYNTPDPPPLAYSGSASLSGSGSLSVNRPTKETKQFLAGSRLGTMTTIPGSGSGTNVPPIS
jgi:hypothetical protein